MAEDRGSSDLFKQIWLFFASVKLTVTVLLTLAATSIIGTLIPQNESPAAYVNAFGDFIYRIFYILDIFDMYHSWWFQFLLLLLATNVIVCSVERLSATWKIIFTENPKFNPNQFTGQKEKEKYVTGCSLEQTQKRYAPYISKLFNYNRIESLDDGYRILAEKGRWTRLGVYTVHLSVLLLLTGGLVGSFFGFEGFVNIPEGETVSSITLRNTGQKKPLDFSIRCEDFDVQFYDTGAPKEYRSSLTVIEGGKPILKKDIIVNDPLRYRGINVFQSSYGTLSPKEVTLSFKSQSTSMVYMKTAVKGNAVEIPENGGEFIFQDYRNSFDFRGHDLGEVFLGTLKSPDGSNANVILPKRFPEFDKMRKSRWLISVTDAEYRYYTGLQVTKDPSVWIVYAGFIIMILGCFITFFMSHQRIFIEVLEKGKHRAVLVSGTSDRNKLGMNKKIKTIAQELTRLGEV
ncbi:MAG TPA: cytochrome c biogenesis protein ResB [Deltaproteobacteria bacterium]|nr:cytochrome c biogenesis protein ResB [Deltaproteobacteria bacterium]